MTRKNSRERTTLDRLHHLRRHTKVIGLMFKDLWPVFVIVLPLLGMTLRQLA